MAETVEAEQPTPAPLRIGDVGGFTPDAFIVDPDVARKTIARQHLSPSTMNTLAEDCNASWAASKVLPFDDSPESPAGAGGWVHLAFERFYSLPADQRSSEALAEQINRVAAEAADGDLARMQLLSAKYRHLAWGIFELEDPTDVEVHSVEQKLFTEIDGVPVQGTIDRTDVVDGKLVLRDFKGLAVDTPIPTPTGWTTMGALTVGDQVLGSNGGPVNVVAKSQTHHRPCYNVKTSDGIAVTCDNVHLWAVRIGSPANEEVVVDADQLYEMYQRLASEGRTRALSIRNADPLNLPEADLPISPYVLGAWLGDGASRSGEITCGNDDVEETADIIREEWGEVSLRRNKDRAASATPVTPAPGRCPFGVRKPNRRDSRYCCAECRESCSAGRQPRRDDGWNVPLMTLLKRHGLLHNKHVPVEYLRGSYDQRLSLLQGLMDTDGYWNTSRGRAVFGTSTPALRDAVVELVAGLGATPQVSSGDNGHRGWMRVEFSPAGFNPFRITRKREGAQDRVDQGRTFGSRYRTIVSVEPKDSVPTECIAVDAEDSLYLCGPAMLVTHNTGKVPKPRYDTYPHAMRTYALIYEQIYGELPVEAWLYYTKDEIAVAKEIDLSEGALKKTRRRLATQWQKHNSQIEAASFPTKTGPLCGWCPLVQLCPAAAAEGRKVSTRANMTPLAVEDHNIDNPLEVLAAAEAAEVLAGDVTADDVASAGHPSGDADQPRAKKPRTDNHEETPMRIDETSPYEKYTRSGDMNPSSWAVNNLFTLRAAAADAITAYMETAEDAELDAAELTQHLFRETALTVAGAQRDWIGVGPDTQAASFNRLTYVAKDFLATRATDFADEEELSSFLDEMAEEMLIVVEQVYEVFDLIDDEAEAIAEDNGESADGGGPWKR